MGDKTGTFISVNKSMVFCGFTESKANDVALIKVSIAGSFVPSPSKSR